MMLDHDLDPEEWEVVHLTINEWEGPPVVLDQKVAEEKELEAIDNRKYTQIKINLRHVKPLHLVLPARMPGTYHRQNTSRRSESSRLIVLLGDQHAPHHEPVLHDAVVAWLGHNQPQEAVLLGDLLDFPEISRHRHDPAWMATTQECVDAGYSILREYVSTSEDTNWTFIEGNHEARLRNAIIDQVKDLHGLRPGGDPALHPALSMTNLLRLDEIGVQWEGSDATYEHTKVKLSDHLAAIHGHIATKHSGTSAKRSLEQYGHSVVQGHSHRSSMVFQTIYDINGRPETLTAAEAGCLCKLEGGLGYTVNSDWQQGFCTATVYPDGCFKLDLATFVEGTLFWRDQRW